MVWEPEVDIEEPSWLDACCFGEHVPRYPHTAAHNQFVRTNALVVSIGNRRPRSPTDAARFVAEIDALIDYAPQIPNSELRARALEAYRKARELFAAQAEASSR